MIKIIPHKFLNANIGRVRLIEKFIRFKVAYPNSRIYNYNPTALHKQGRLSYSRNTIDKTVQQFLALGWARIENKHLILTSKRDLYDVAIEQELAILKRKGKRLKEWEKKKQYSLKRKLRSGIKPLFVEIPTSVQTLSLELQAVALRSLQKRKSFRRLTGETMNNRTKNKYSRPNSTKNLNSSSDNAFSYSLIASVLQISKTEAFRTISKMNKLGMIQMFRSYPVFIGKCVQALTYIPNSFVSKKGYVWSVPPNAYLFDPQ